MRMALKEGHPLPQKIQNAPVVPPHLELYFRAFFELDSSRSIGFSEGPIPWQVVIEYCKRYNLSEEQTETMVYHIRQMDVAYLEFRSKKRKV